MLPSLQLDIDRNFRHHSDCSRWSDSCAACNHLHFVEKVYLNHYTNSLSITKINVTDYFKIFVLLLLVKKCRLKNNERSEQTQLQVR